MVGKKVGRFEIVRKIGRGGMASVWEARDTFLDRTVAIKLLDPDLAEVPQARTRFEREAKTAASLDHPSIVAIYDWGESEGRFYIAMALVDGETVSERARRRLIPVAEMLHIAEQAAAALGYAHARNVIHRDVSGRNVMVARDGRVFVLDFGLALVEGASRLTSTGGVLGTLAYIAPETLVQRAADARSDLYSLGVILYEGLTGALPFDGDRAEAISFEVLNRSAAPPSRLRPELGGEIDQIVLRAIARNPNDRYENAERMVDDLRQARTALDESGPKTHSRPKMRPHEQTDAIHSGEPVAEKPAPLYLAIVPFADPRAAAGSEEDGERKRLLDDLASATACAVSMAQRLHVVAIPDDAARAAGQDLSAFARAVGANRVLMADVRFSGTSIRVRYRLLDPDRGEQVGGDLVDGSKLDPFDLETRLAHSVRSALGLDEIAPVVSPTRPKDRAAEDRYQQALSYLKRRDNEASIDGAIGILTTLAEQDGESVTVQAALARACLYKHRLTRQRSWEGQAVAACERAIGLDANAPEALVARGEIDADAGRAESALSWFDQALVARPGLFEALLGRASVLEALDRHEQAETECRSAIEANPDDWRGHHTLGLIRFRRGRYADAIESWQKVTELTPDNAGAYRNLGAAFFETDRYPEADASLRRSLEMCPNAMAYWNLGTVQFFLERYDECLAAFEKAVDLNPADPVAWGNLGNACLLIPGHEARAVETLEHASGLMSEHLSRHPGHSEGWARLSGWHAGLGQEERAVHAIERALEIAPDDVFCLRSAGHTFFRIGQRKKALELLARAVERGFSTDMLRRDPDLRPLHDDPEFRKILDRGANPSRPRTRVPKPRR